MSAWRSKLVTLLLVVLGVALALGVAPASAIKFGQPDGDGHPYVGLAVFYEKGVPLWRCSGALLSSTEFPSTEFLTAGHCSGVDASTGEKPDAAQVWFDPGPIPSDPDYDAAVDANGGKSVSCNASPAFDGYPCAGGVMGTPIADPLWSGVLTVPQTHDVGVVLLDSPVSLSQYAQLPPVGYLDPLASKRGQQDVEFTIVGYGLQSVKPVLSSERTRMVATVTLVNLRSALTDRWNVRVSNNPGQGHGGSGGSCLGDSGGPLLQGNTVVGVNSFVSNENCDGSAYFYRVDTESAQGFIDNPE